MNEIGARKMRELAHLIEEKISIFKNKKDFKTPEEN